MMDALAAAMVIAAVLVFLHAYRLLKKKKEETSAVRRNYDVFLSFGGRDTPTGFADFLYNSLVADGIRVFREDDELRFGEQIYPDHLEAIRNSRIAIPIISKDYARRKNCLCELAEMMNCRKEQGQSVFPIFYDVDVVYVDRQRGRFEEALREHEREYGSEEVLKWREALTSVASIRGWTSQATAYRYRGEAELVELVRERVSSELWKMGIARLPTIIRSVYLLLSEEQRTESEYQVFLAFRGIDTRYGLAAYLRTTLVAAGIEVFNDDYPSLIGKDVKDVAHEIRNAIDHSKISIAILSENFISSRWCLDDLAQIVDCKRTKGQRILPIFYKVNPSQVEDASHRLLPEDEGTYDRWQQALREVGSCKYGWKLEQIADRDKEGILVERVVQEVLRLLKNPKET